VSLQTENHTSFFEKRTQTIGVVLIIFIAGMILGIALLQFFDGGNNNDSQVEKVELKNANIWVMIDQRSSQGVVLLVNEGNTASKIKEITVRGIECSWSDVYYWTANIGSITGELELSANELSGSSVIIEVDDKEQVFAGATGEINLNAYQMIILYLNNPGNLMSEDTPSQVTLAVFTERNMYSQDISVDRTFKFQRSSSITITNVQFTGSGSSITLTFENTGTESITISQVKVNGIIAAITSNSMTASDAGDVGSLELTAGWVSGKPYKIDLYASNGQIVGSYVATAPG
jgi:hypothetical protein